MKRRSGRIFAATATASLAAAVLAVAPAGQVLASTPGTARTTSFVSFNTFLKTTAGAGYRSFAATSRPDAVRTARVFGQMRSYILATYRGVKVEHSFILGGSYFDCVTIRSQPTVRDRGIRTIATPPPRAAPGPRTARHAGRALASPLTLGHKDRFSHAISCPAGTIPMRRITLAGMTRFPTLAAFLAKGPRGSGRAQIPPAFDQHRWAIGYQYVYNDGGNAWLNVWNPEGDFTLSQQGYIGTSASGAGQTIEGGWIHYPNKFGYNSALFIYWTSNSYSNGCYNLDCPAFVQVNRSIPLGASFSQYSTYGGPQVGFGMQWYYYQGNWWMVTIRKCCGS
jgi:hypothetical protein